MSLHRECIPSVLPINLSWFLNFYLFTTLPAPTAKRANSSFQFLALGGSCQPDEFWLYDLCVLWLKYFEQILPDLDILDEFWLSNLCVLWLQYFEQILPDPNILNEFWLCNLCVLWLQYFEQIFSSVFFLTVEQTSWET